MIELYIAGSDISNAKTIAKILKYSGYDVRIVNKRHKFSHRNDTYIQIIDTVPSQFKEYIKETIIDFK